MASAETNTLSAAGTRRPSSAMSPNVKAMSVAMGTPQPPMVGPPQLIAA